MKFSRIAALAFLMGAMSALASPLSGTGATDNALTQARPDKTNAFPIRSAGIESAEPVASPDIINLKPAAGELSSNTHNVASTPALDVEDKNSNCSIYCNLFGHIIRCLQSPTFCRCDSTGYVHCEGPSKVCMDNCICQCESKRAAREVNISDAPVAEAPVDNKTGFEVSV
ncbi:hypothetical protein HYQ45_017533 [Verticillium longisporum]|uniref:EGF-like domain-containing protein n=1 Tax=Verticillium longisporum TaxID=100787 RepID=A0A0G4LED5_VERLO|nr:hypothetical protein HYQ45_017533 [Verticillium longisporum]KAG7111996.1 hypothetical protein HYQ44_010191 [Verticillium longisporum]KAG7148054.1 hypothetical protein HYQ46_003082 [Verticillium longisporum]CRK20371.1 hypothetical protein BN1708_012836 [Verticillium longisporum]CRK25875.1 hypothetical protein BN1723_013730 [Verticillium longisporum]